MRVTKLNDSAGITGRQLIEFPDGSSITDVLMSMFPNGVEDSKVTVTLNGKKLRLPSFGDGETVVETGDEHLLTTPLSDGDRVGVIIETKGIEVILFIAAIAFSIVMYNQIAEPPPIENDAATPASNNKFYGQENAAKLYDAIPDIYGTQVSYPDLIVSDAWRQYESSGNLVSKDTFIEQYMCVGLGKYEILSEPKFGGTLISQLEGAYYTVYEPGTDDITTLDNFRAMFQVSQVDGQELLGPFDPDATPAPELELKNRAWVNGDYYDLSDEISIEFVGSEFNHITTDYAVGDIVSLIEAPKDTEGTRFYDFVGEVLLVYPRGSDGAYIVCDVIHATDKIRSNFVELNNDQLGDGRFSKASYKPVGPFDTVVAGHGFVVNIGFPSGCLNKVPFEIEYVEIDAPGGDPVGAPVTLSVEYDGQKYTRGTATGYSKFVCITGDIADGGDGTYERKHYRVSVVRKSNVSADGQRPDLSKWESLYSYIDDNSVTGNALKLKNVTVIKVVIPGRDGSLSPKENKFNVEVRRKTITYNTTTGSINYTLAPSDKFADAILHEYVSVFGQPAETIGLDELYAIQEKIDLDNENLGKFCYTFQDGDIGLEQRIQTIANVARVQMFRDGKAFRFVRDEKRDFISGIITARDISSDREYSKTWESRLPSEYDGLRLEYIDPVLNKKAYIYKQISDGGLVIDAQSKNQRKIELTGCRNVEQAENRAQLEIRKMMKSNFIVNDTLLSQGNLYDIGDVVRYADIYSKDIKGGEIRQVLSADTAILSEQVETVDGEEYFITYNDQFGEPFGPYPVTVDPANKFKVTITGGDFNDAHVADRAVTQLGSRFVVTTLQSGTEHLYVVKEKRPRTENGLVDIVLSQYVESVYDGDYLEGLAPDGGIPGETTEPVITVPPTEVPATEETPATTGWVAMPRYLGLPSGSFTWINVIVSFDGNVITAFTSRGDMAVSSDRGVTWIDRSNAALKSTISSGGSSANIVDAYSARTTGFTGISYILYRKNSTELWVSKTTDNGLTWSDHLVNGYLSSSSTATGKMVCTPDGSRIICFHNRSGVTTEIGAKSFNGGESWSMIYPSNFVVPLGADEYQAPPSASEFGTCRSMSISNTGLFIAASFQTTGGYYSVKSRGEWGTFEIISSYIVTAVDDQETPDVNEEDRTYFYKNCGRLNSAGTSTISTLVAAVYQFSPYGSAIDRGMLCFGNNTATGDITGYAMSYESDAIVTTDTFIGPGYDYVHEYPPSFNGTLWTPAYNSLVESSFDRAACMSGDGRYKMFGGLWVSGPYSSTASMSIDGEPAVMLPLGLNSGSESELPQGSLSSAVQKCATNGQVWVGLISGGWAAICRNI